MTLSPSWLAETLIASYRIWKKSNLPSAQRTTTNSFSLTPQFQENWTAAHYRGIKDAYACRSVLSVWFSQSVKRSIVSASTSVPKHLVTKHSVITKEKQHLFSVLVSNGYSLSVDLIAWWRLAIHSRNVAFYITSDHIVRQTRILYYYCTSPR